MTALTRGIGKQLQIGVAKEVTRGTAVATPAYWLSVNDWAIEERFANATDVEVYGVIEDNISQTRIKNWSEGDIAMPLADKSVPLLFLSLLGTDTPATHAGETLVYDHVITVQQSVQHPSLTFAIHDPIAAADYTYANAVVHKAEIMYELGKFVSLKATTKGLKGASQSAYSPSQTVENRFVPQYLTFKSAANLAGLAAASPIKLKSAQISIDENVMDDDVLGSTSPRDFLNQEFKVEGQLECIWQNESDFKTNALANTAQALRFDLLNADVTIGTSAHPEIIVDLAKVVFTEFSRPVKIKGIMYQTVKFKAAYSVSDAQMIKVTCTNLVASY